MTKKRLLELAYSEALRNWKIEARLLEKYPSDDAAAKRELEAWDEVYDISAQLMLVDLEKNA